MAHWNQRIPKFAYKPGKTCNSLATAQYAVLVCTYRIPFNPSAPRADNFSSLFVPTVETTRLSHLLDLLLPNQHHVMFVGNSGEPSKGQGERVCDAHTVCQCGAHQLPVWDVARQVPAFQARSMLSACLQARARLP